MTNERQKIKKATIFMKTHHKIDGNFPDRGVWIRSFFSYHTFIHLFNLKRY